MILGAMTHYIAVPFLSGYLHLHDTTIGVLGIIGCIANTVGNSQLLILNRIDMV